MQKGFLTMYSLCVSILQFQVCYRIKRDGQQALLETDSSEKRLKTSRSRELRGSVLYRGCDCEKLNGLQDDCRRSECMGSDCLAHPESCCGPSVYSNAKHLQKSTEEPKDVRSRIEESNAGYHCFPAYLRTEDNSCPVIPRLPW